MTISSEPGSEFKSGRKKSHHDQKAAIQRVTLFFFPSLIIFQILQASASDSQT